MLNRLKNTLGSERGATLLMALFALLLASMVCIVILSAATSSMKQEHAERIATQEELALKSAASMLASNMTSDKTKCVIVEKKGVVQTPDVPEYCLFSSDLERAMWEYAATKEADGTFYIKASSPKASAADAGVTEEEAHEAYEGAVRASYVIKDERDAECVIIFTLDVLEGSAPEGYKVKATTYLKLKGKTSSVTNTTDETKTTTYTWSEPSMYQAENR